jgi:hypothetical protein
MQSGYQIFFCIEPSSTSCASKLVLLLRIPWICPDCPVLQLLRWFEVLCSVASPARSLRVILLQSVTLSHFFKWFTCWYRLHANFSSACEPCPCDVASPILHFFVASGWSYPSPVQVCGCLEGFFLPNVRFWSRHRSRWKAMPALKLQQRVVLSRQVSEQVRRRLRRQEAHQDHRMVNIRSDRFVYRVPGSAKQDKVSTNLANDRMCGLQN